MAGQHVQPIDLAGQFAGQRRHGRVALLGHMLGRAGSVGAGDPVQPVLFEKALALAQQHRVAHRMGDLVELRAFDPQQVDMHPHEGFLDDMQPGLRQHRVDVGDPAIGRVLDRQHRQIGGAGFHRIDRVFEGAAGQRLHLRPGLMAGLVAVGAGLSLERDPVGHVAGFPEVGRFVALSIPCLRQGEGLDNRQRQQMDSRSMDTMTSTKVVAGFCAAFLVFLLGKWAAEGIYHVGGHGEQAYVIDTGVVESDGGGEDDVDFAALVAEADPDKGASVFRRCQACHRVEPGENITGPTLYGVVGRAVGGVDGFGYSDAMANHGGTWTIEELSAFLENPRNSVPGTAMSFAGLRSDTDRANVIAYLQSLSN